jgi:hypothetical protein
MYPFFLKDFVTVVKPPEVYKAKFFQADPGKNYIGRSIALRTKRIKNPIKTE